MVEADTGEMFGVAFGGGGMMTGLDVDLQLAVAGGTRGAAVLWRVRRDEVAQFVAELMLPQVSTAGRSAGLCHA
jgi:hypothetical protein